MMLNCLWPDCDEPEVLGFYVKAMTREIKCLTVDKKIRYGLKNMDVNGRLFHCIGY